MYNITRYFQSVQKNVLYYGIWDANAYGFSCMCATLSTALCL